MGDEGVKFERLKLPNHGVMPGVSFAASCAHFPSAGPRIFLFGGQRRGLCNELWQFEPSGDGWLQLQPDPTVTGLNPAERTQTSLVSIGPTDAQTTMILFAGYCLNVAEQNDLWSLEVGVDENTMPVSIWKRIEATGDAPASRYGHSAAVVGASMVVYAGQEIGRAHV